MRQTSFRLLMASVLLAWQTHGVFAQLEYTNSMSINNVQPTDNAEALGKFGSVPVNLSTGQPSIGVPLHTISYGGMTVPISLSYDASGVRVDQHPTWVGLGWALQAGGVVTRQVQGIADDYQYPHNNDPSFGNSLKGYLFESSKLNTSTWLDNNYFLNLTLKYSGSSWNPEQIVDGIPDNFTFNFGGYSGTFFIDETGTWRIQSKDKLALEIHHEVNPIDSPFVFTECPSLMRIPRLITKFTIYTPDGTKYEFGGDVNSMEYSRALQDDFYLTHQGDNTLYNISPTAWYLTRITKPDGKFIEFTYESGRNLMRFTRSVQSYKYTTASYPSSGTNLAYIYGNIITPCYLKHIKTPFQEIDFYRSFSTEQEFSETGVSWVDYETTPPTHHTLGEFERKSLIVNDFNFAYRGWRDYHCGAKYTFGLPLEKSLHTNPYTTNRMPTYSMQLDSIVVTGKPAGATTGALWKTITLEHTADPDKRRFLEGVTIEGPLGWREGSYSFSYINPGQFPNYNSFEKDQWGYYNGSNYNFSPNPHTSNWRLPDPSLAQYGTLRSIRYPTGGTTRFEYELNDYRKYQSVSVLADGADCETTLAQASSNNFAGGLRIKKIIDSAGYNAPVITKSYYYNTDHINGGTTSSGILSGKSDYTEFLEFQNFCDANLGFSGTWSDNEFSPYGEPVRAVTYSEVTEVTNDGAATVYKYSNYDTDLNGVQLDEPHIQSRMLGTSESDVYQLSSNALERGLLLSETAYNSSGTRVYEKEYEYDFASDRKNKFAKAIRRHDNLRQRINPEIYWWNRICFEQVVFRTYAFKKYYYNLPLKKITETQYNGSNTIANTKTFTYDDYGNITSTTTGTSDQQFVTERVKYNVHPDYLSGSVSTPEAIGIRNLFTQFKVKNAPIEKITTIRPNTGGTIDPTQIRIMDGSLYQYITYQPRINKVFKLELDEPFPQSIWSGSFLVSNFNHSKIQSGDLVYDNRYKLQEYINHYVHNAKGMPAMVETRSGSEAYTVDYLGERITSVTKGAQVNQAAYTSFEGGATYTAPGGVIDDNKGLWDFSPNDIVDGGFTGQKALSSTASSISPSARDVTSRVNLSPGKPYQLAIWANGPDPLVYVGTVLQPMPPVVKQIYPGWKLFIYNLSGNNEKVSIVGSSTTTPTKLDELRLYPAGAQMKSYTYDWVTGNIQTLCDEANRIYWYRYDELGRLQHTTDENYQVLEQYYYQIHQ